MNGRNALPIPPASPERQLKLEQSAQESANLTLRDVRCPRCNYLIIRVYGCQVFLILKQKTIELTLCTTCARQFYSSKSHFIKRTDLWQAEREVCMFCNTRRGFDFLISDIELR